MKINKGIKGSLFTLLVRNYIFFTMAIAILLGTIMLISNYRYDAIMREPKVNDLVDYASLVSKEEYGGMPIEKLMGKGSYIEVLDKDNNVVYKSKGDKINKEYTKDELECIQSYLPQCEIRVEEYYNSKNEKNTSVTINYYSDENRDKIYIIDKDLNLIYTNIKTNRKSFTENEFKYLTGEEFKEYDVRKYKFKNKNNEDFTLISYIPRFGDSIAKRLSNATNESIIAFIVVYIILAILFILWMNKKIKKPLKILNGAIVDFKNGIRRTYLQYEGPKEFADIFHSFNDMSSKLYESEQRSKRLEEEKQKMLADISHDLKTPITVIKGYSKAVCDNLVNEDEKNQYLMTIYQKADNLDELINTFHEYSKMEHPEYKLVLEKMDICEYIRAYLAQKYNELYISGVELNADIPESVIYCDIDKVQLKRVFENLVSNTLKHNKNKVSILFNIKEIDDKVRIIIGDNGVGISKSIAKNIFDPFVVGEQSRTKQGSGLGLALSKKIIEAHSGAIRLVDAKKNYKTVFEILLPISKK
ncbi:sensor histidine kinase [Romboutsia sp. 1001713B170207_170306_H8]|uniref:sensor histidine kinase n=1 Tax=Romboutsia sp. 1001713B170207_170306_H8 TaxID=2787112 RepID=UPI000820FCB8|nr:HAMP domain-containing sensor histidine kinase [Romboutsia sp. 1001713B170207_170306_H8]SCI14350.1 Alkaline phosphatase synthesis sensor protein phoR [uncultured Clostridium sp.]